MISENLLRGIKQQLLKNNKYTFKKGIFLLNGKWLQLLSSS